MAVREFKLMNNLGQEYSLMDIENYAFLSDPSGLGFSYRNSYQKLGNHFSPSSKELEQESMDPILYFKKYESYRNLCSFIHRSSSLILVYIVPYETSTKTYYKDIDVTNITKSEKDPKTGCLKCSATFVNISLWYEKSITKYIIEDEDDSTIWDFYFDSYFPSYSSKDLNYINEGDVDGSIDVVVDGEVINPVLRLYIEGNLHQEITINTTIAVDEKLCYSSQEDNFYIKKRKPNGTYENLYSLDVISLDNDNVIRIPPGKECRLTITANSPISSAEVIIYTYYVSV